jgi:hypothetical protein
MTARAGIVAEDNVRTLIDRKAIVLVLDGVSRDSL